MDNPQTRARDATLVIIVAKGASSGATKLLLSDTVVSAPEFTSSAWKKTVAGRRVECPEHEADFDRVDILWGMLPGAKHQTGATMTPRPTHGKSTSGQELHDPLGAGDGTAEQMPARASNVERFSSSGVDLEGGLTSALAAASTGEPSAAEVRRRRNLGGRPPLEAGSPTETWKVRAPSSLGSAAREAGARYSGGFSAFVRDAVREKLAGATHGRD